MGGVIFVGSVAPMLLTRVSLALLSFAGRHEAGGR